MPKFPTTLRWLLLMLAGLGAGILWFDSKTSEPALPVAVQVREGNSRLNDLPGGTEGNSASTPDPSRAIPIRSLFTFARPANSAELDQALPAPARAIHYVRLNADLISGKPSPFWQKPGAGRFELPLPEGGSVVVAIDGSEMLGPDRFSSAGRIEGRPLSRAVFAWHGGFLHASIEDPVWGKFALRAATGEYSQFYRIDPALVPPCAGERRIHDADRGPARAAGSHFPSRSAPPTSSLASAVNPQRAEVHVLMVYTPAVLTTLSGAPRRAALQSGFDLAIAKVNAAFEASLITARVRLVGIAETPYDENASVPAKVQDDALTALYKIDDGKMDEIHAVRDAAGADIVCLAMGRRDSASSGLSFLLDSPADNANPDFAFSVVSYDNMAGTNVVAHEFGHVLGCAHDRQNALSGEGAYAYSYGYRFFGTDGRQYHDIMSYPPGIELSYFSNPNVIVPTPVNAPIGIAAGRPGESDAALTIEQNAFATASFRLQTQTLAGAGSLINVATRAFVGTGDRVLIGGFVIQGTQPKDLLIRAAGPVLANFGITNALADPVLQIFAGSALAAENDNWSSPIDPARAAAAGEIATAAVRTGAFPFPGGSNDAAVLVTLPPGAYTAIVEGARGATGTGLVEAYEVGRDTNRIIALATRGFADRTGNEMYAGFVVQGEAGTTKRVLVRVLGPTLARPPFNMPGALDDPEMEIRNAAGETLIRNDDWSTDSEGGANAENDYKPVVQTHGEKQIFATGHAPSNRREPCVLVDLPPGSYTAVVRPFELRSPDPARDQPAQPGLGVVEVYEIAR